MNPQPPMDQTETLRAINLKLEPEPKNDDELVPQLTVISGPQIGMVFRFIQNRQQMTLGRKDADFIVADDMVSRLHAAIVWQRDNIVHLHDLKSTNGTFVNGERITTAKLNHGDKITLGEIMLRFDLLDPIEAQYQSELAKKLSDALQDPLTGLFTRKHLDSAGQKLLSTCLLKNQPCSLIMLDLDRFKSVNDTHGHAIGDKVLKTVGTVIMRSIRSMDLACRYGGEEIAIILPNSPLKAAVEFAERLRRLISDQEIATEQDPLTVTVSVGVAEAASDESLAAGLARADKGLYLAKNTGRNRVALAPFPMSQ